MLALFWEVVELLGHSLAAGHWPLRLDLENSIWHRLHAKLYFPSQQDLKEPHLKLMSLCTAGLQPSRRSRLLHQDRLSKSFPPKSHLSAALIQPWEKWWTQLSYGIGVCLKSMSYVSLHQGMGRGSEHVGSKEESDGCLTYVLKRQHRLYWFLRVWLRIFQMIP